MKRRAWEGLLDVDQEVRSRPEPRRVEMTTVCTVIGPPPSLDRATLCGEATTLACSRKPMTAHDGCRRTE